MKCVENSIILLQFNIFVMCGQGWQTDRSQPREGSFKVCENVGKFVNLCEKSYFGMVIISVNFILSI